MKQQFIESYFPNDNKRACAREREPYISNRQTHVSVLVKFIDRYVNFALPNL